MNDDADHPDETGNGPPSVSRISRGGMRRYRTATRYTARERFPRQRRQQLIAELIGLLVERHGLTDEMRQRFVCLYWDELAGERIAPKTWPLSFSEGVLHVSAASSSWVHELQFHKAALIRQINQGVEANRVWLSEGPLVTDIRFVLGTQKRAPLVDREFARRLRLRRRLRRPLDATPQSASALEQDAIRSETSSVDDDELRALIESVRVKWNR